MMFPFVGSCQGATFVAGENVMLLGMYDCNEYVVQSPVSFIIAGLHSFLYMV
jgi:hypothetical protein